MSYGTNIAELYRYLATYADKFKRRKAGRPDGRAADEVRASDQSQNGNQIVLTIPPNVLARADRVIK